MTDEEFKFKMMADMSHVHSEQIRQLQTQIRDLWRVIMEMQRNQGNRPPQQWPTYTGGAL